MWLSGGGAGEARALILSFSGEVTVGRAKMTSIRSSRRRTSVGRTADGGRSRRVIERGMVWPCDVVD